MALPVKSLALLAVLGSVALTGCGSNGSSTIAESAEASAIATESAVSSEEATAEPTADSAETYAQAEGQVNPLATPSTCATPSLEPSEAKVAEGYKLVSATANKLSLAVPESWITVTPGAEDGEVQMKSYMEATGVDQMNTETMQQQLQYLDMLASPQEANDKGYRENISVYAAPMAVACEPSEDTLREVVGRNYGSPSEYKVVASSLGEVATMTYALANTTGVPVYGELAMAPVPGSENEYAIINIATLDKETTAEYAQKVLDSLQVVAE